MKAARDTIYQQIALYKWNLPTVVACNKCGVSLRGKDRCLDHVVPFVVLFESWLKSEKLSLSDIRLFWTQCPMKTGARWRQLQHESWEEYHRRHASYVVLCRSCNSKKGVRVNPELTETSAQLQIYDCTAMITLGNKTFATKKQLLEYVQSRLDTYGLEGTECAVPKDEDSELFSALAALSKNKSDLLPNVVVRLCGKTPSIYLQSADKKTVKNAAITNISFRAKKPETKVEAKREVKSEDKPVRKTVKESTRFEFQPQDFDFSA